MRPNRLPVLLRPRPTAAEGQARYPAARHLCSKFWDVRMFKNLIPKVFYDRLRDGIEFFVDGLGFEALYQDAVMAFIARDSAKAYLVQSPAYAARDRPELAIDTGNVDEIVTEASRRSPPSSHSGDAGVALILLTRARQQLVQAEPTSRRLDPGVGANRKLL